VSEWVAGWVGTLDVALRTAENYASRLPNHILPR